MTMRCQGKWKMEKSKWKMTEQNLKMNSSNDYMLGLCG